MEICVLEITDTSAFAVKGVRLPWFEEMPVYTRGRVLCDKDEWVPTPHLLSVDQVSIRRQPVVFQF